MSKVAVRKTLGWSLTISDPVSYQVIQRSGGTADIVVAGTYGGGSPAAVEARFNGGSWATIDAAPADGAFGGTLANQPAGQGLLEVRFTNDALSVGSVEHVGIGDVFAVFGQSNAVGQGQNNQVYSHATLRAGLFGNDYLWHELTDPTDIGTNFVDAVADDYTATGGLVTPAGSVWPLLATLLLAGQNVPVAFVPCGLSGAGIASFLPGSPVTNTETLFGSMLTRCLSVGGVKCVLWHQGESDTGYSSDYYNTRLDTIANQIGTSLGVGLMPCKLQDLSGIGRDETNVNVAIATAWSDNANVLTGPDFSDITPGVDGLHWKTDQELQTAADRWYAALVAAFYGD